MNILSDILLVISWFIVGFGLLGVYRFKNLYSRLLTSSKIDSAAVLLIIVALIIRTGFNYMSLKMVIIMIFVAFTSPITNHLIVYSAFRNGLPLKEEEDA